MQLSNEDGFTLMEVLIAMVILGFVLLSVQATVTQRFVSEISMQSGDAVADQLVSDRLQMIQQDPAYVELVTRYAGTETEPDVPEGYTRKTVVNRTQRDGLDYSTITVTVEGQGVRRPIARTIVIGAP